MSAHIEEVNDANFEAEIDKHEGYALVDFWGAGCGPCMMLAPILVELCAEFPQVKLRKLEIYDNAETAARLGVRGLPTMILFKNGEKLDTKIGLPSKSQLKSWIESHVK